MSTWIIGYDDAHGAHVLLPLRVATEAARDGEAEAAKNPDAGEVCDISGAPMKHRAEITLDVVQLEELRELFTSLQRLLQIRRQSSRMPDGRFARRPPIDRPARAFYIDARLTAADRDVWPKLSGPDDLVFRRRR